MNNIAKPVLFQAPLSKPSIKTLNKFVFSRLARLDKTQLHALLKGPSLQSSAGEVQSLTSYYRLRINTEHRDTFQNTRALYGVVCVLRTIR